ncbi:MAG: cache domain-containing protein [Candidatus Altiarchaeota archaeon]|nr:cache domain-containing protein [Candidatus Altiarchaeota archaeon]
MSKREIKREVASIFLMMGLVYLGIYVVYERQTTSGIEELTGESLENIAIEVSDEINRLLEERSLDMQALSKQLTATSNASRDEKRALMTRVQETYREFDDISLIDVDGNVVTSTSFNYRGEFKASQWFRDALNGSTVMSDPHIILDPKRTVIQFFAPVRGDEDEIVGVVAGQVDMSHIWQITDGVTVGQTGYAFILDERGTILAHPDKTRILGRKELPMTVMAESRCASGISSYSGPGGAEYTAGHYPVGMENHLMRGCWDVYVAQEKAEIDERVAKVQRNIAYVMAAGLFAILVLSLTTIYLVGRPDSTSP